MKKIIDKIIAYLFIMCTILLSSTLWQFNKLLSGVIKLIWAVIILYVIINLLFVKNNKKIIRLYQKSFLLFLYLLIGVTLNINYNYKGFIATFIISFFSILLVVFWIYNKSINIFKIYKRIIVNYAKVNLILFVLFSLFKIVEPTSSIKPVGLNVWYRSFFNMHFESQLININGFQYVRNGGIFVEPGAYSLYLVAALAISLFTLTQIRKSEVFILIVTILTTLSSTGIILSTIFIIIRLSSAKAKGNVQKMLMIYFTPIIIVLTMIFAINSLNNKIKNYGEKSVSVRLDDVKVGMRLFAEKPLTGWGFGNREVLLERQNIYIRGNDIGGMSNGLLGALYMNGIYIVPFYILPLIFFIKSKRFSKKQKLIFIMYIVVELNSYPFEASRYMMLILSIGWIEYINRKNYSIKRME